MKIDNKIIEKIRYQFQRYDEFREKANVYAGAAMGFATPIVATGIALDYASNLASRAGYTHPSEIAIWAGSIALNAVSTIATFGFPLVHSTVAGAALGVNSAEHLRRNKMKRAEAEKRKISLEEIANSLEKK